MKKKYYNPEIKEIKLDLNMETTTVSPGIETEDEFDNHLDIQ